MLRRDATYQRAIAAGYSVSDDEINDYLDDLKVTINDSINSEEAQALISQFGSEEEYWQHEFEVYKINLPIEKYLESLKQEYLQNSISTQSNNQEAEKTIEKNILKFIVSMCSGKNIIIDQRITSKRTII